MDHRLSSEISDFLIKNDFIYEDSEWNYEIFYKNDIRIKYEYYIQFNNEPNEEKIMDIQILDNHFRLLDNDITLYNIKNLVREYKMNIILNEVKL